MQQWIVVLVIAAGYVALAEVSKLIAYSPADAWTVWLASGLVLGALLGWRRERWRAVLAGAFIGAALFSVRIGTDVLDALGYGVIEVAGSGAAAYLVSRLAPLPLRLESSRDLAALIAAGALPLALIGGLFAAAWHVTTGGQQMGTTFRVWVLSNFIGSLLVAPLVISWSQFRVRRSGGMTMSTFGTGALACALFLLTVQILFDAATGSRFGGLVGRALTYVPIVFMALVALLWGTRGATFAAFVGALIAMVNTAQGEGPFAGYEGFLGDPELEVEGYALAIAMTGLLVAVLAAAQRNAARAAREWQTRFEAAISAHRLLAYEWDAVSNRMVVTGDADALMGVPATKIGVLADWLALVAAGDRERVQTRFDERVRGQGEGDTITYLVQGPSGATLAATDEARAIRDHDGELHRIVGIVRMGNAPAAAAA